MSLPDLFKHQNALAALRPANIQQLASKQTPQDHTKPELLQRLEGCLHDARRAASGLQATQNTWGARQVELHAHRQVFDMFIGSMTTYRPLLLRIKQAYLAALEDAAATASDHVQLHTELSLMASRHAEAVAAAKQHAERSAADMEDELVSKLQELEWQAEQASKEFAVTDEQLHHYQRHIAQARRELEQLETSNRRVYQELLENSSWHLLSRLPTQQDTGSISSHLGRACGSAE